jgi:hypothetical protein
MLKGKQTVRRNEKNYKSEKKVKNERRREATRGLEGREK